MIVDRPADFSFDVQPVPFWVTFSETLFKAQSSKLERLFSLKSGKRDVRALSFEP